MSLFERLFSHSSSSLHSLQMIKSRKRTRSEASSEATIINSKRDLVDFDGDIDVDFNRLARKRKPKKLDGVPEGEKEVGKPEEKVKEEDKASVVKKAKLAITHFFSSSSSSSSLKESSSCEVSMSMLTIRAGRSGNDKRDLDFAGLDNVGNTCFVNSCLYALRFMPEFPAVMHNFCQTKILELKKKENVEMSEDASKAAILVTNLHEVFHQLRKREITNGGKKNPETFRPMAFVDSFRKSQPSYEKGEQFDAQEFLSHLLNTMSVLSKEIERIETEEAEKRRAKLAEALALKARGRLARRRKGSAEEPKLPSTVNPWALAKGESILKTVVKAITHHQTNGEVEGGLRKSTRKRKSVDYGEQFIVSNPISKKEVPSVAKLCDYQDTHMTGTCVVSMTCLDCEESTSVKENFTSIAIPVASESDEDPVKFFDRLRLEEELITDDNKIFCTFCHTRQEGRRTVTYASLPRVLVLHLKRFSTFFNSRTARVESEKATDYLSTPTSIPCFCSQCTSSTKEEEGETKETERPHSDYQLHGIVEHQGSISCGHYVAYCRLPPASFNTVAPPAKKRRNSSGNEINPLDCCYPASLDENSDRSWVRCDDCVINRLTEEDVMKVLGDNGPKAITPYLLFYVRSSG